MNHYEKSIKTAIFACVFAVAFQITAFAGFSWRVESADSSYVGTTNVTVTNTSGKKETEDAPIVRKGAVVTFTEAVASATYTVKAYDGMGNPIRDFNASLGTIKKVEHFSIHWTGTRENPKESLPTPDRQAFLRSRRRIPTERPGDRDS